MHTSLSRPAIQPGKSYYLSASQRGAAEEITAPGQYDLYLFYLSVGYVISRRLYEANAITAKDQRTGFCGTACLGYSFDVHFNPLHSRLLNPVMLLCIIAWDVMDDDGKIMTIVGSYG